MREGIENNLLITCSVNPYFLDGQPLWQDDEWIYNKCNYKAIGLGK